MPDMVIRCVCGGKSRLCGNAPSVCQAQMRQRWDILMHTMVVVERSGLRTEAQSIDPRIDVAIPKANGKLKYMKELNVSVIMCASNATVPSNPANIVVTSNDHASAPNASAPSIPNFQNGFSIEYCKLAFDIVGQTVSTVSLHRLTRWKQDLCINNKLGSLASYYYILQNFIQ